MISIKDYMTALVLLLGYWGVFKCSGSDLRQKFPQEHQITQDRHITYNRNHKEGIVTKLGDDEHDVVEPLRTQQVMRLYGIHTIASSMQRC